MKKKTTKEVVAAINVGSDFLRMSIAQLNPDGTLMILEDAFLPNNIGKDTFAPSEGIFLLINLTYSLHKINNDLTNVVYNEYNLGY